MTTFTVSMVAEGSFDDNAELTLPLNPSGPPTTVSVVRSQYGSALGLTSNHSAYVNGSVVDDTYQVQSGDELTFRVNSKTRG
jgi:hypothetical protein